MTELKLSDNDFWLKINEIFSSKGGVYFLFCRDENDKNTPINRLLKTDKNGILYIGKTSSFLDRVIELKKSLSPTHFSTGHECGSRMKTLNLLDKFEYERLFVELMGSDNEKVLEMEKLSKYEIEFGELPPLNRMK